MDQFFLAFQREYDDYRAYLDQTSDPIVKDFAREERVFETGEASFFDALILEISLLRLPCSMVLLGPESDRLHQFHLGRVHRVEFPRPTDECQADINYLFLRRKEELWEIRVHFKGTQSVLMIEFDEFEYREILFARPLTREEYVSLGDWLYPTISDRMVHRLPSLFQSERSD